MKTGFSPTFVIALFVPTALAATAITVANPQTTSPAAHEGAGRVVYIAHLHSLNSVVTGRKAAGEARFVVDGDALVIAIDAHGLPPDMMHLQHFHGFADNRQATCPTAAADRNGDGIIDLKETEPMAGTTMVPFHADPVSMQIASDSYPRASAAGTFTYRKTVSLAAFTTAFEKAFGSAALDLDRRVVFIHGVVPSAKLPGTVASLGDIPARITLPVACGVIERVAG
ncbi:MAG: hypothetical protein ACREPQ_04405 [Rhodanobacter sp.]